MSSVQVIGGKLKGQSRLALDGVVFRLSLGDEIHRTYARWKGDQPGNRIIDSLVYRCDGGSIIISTDEGSHGILLHASIALDNYDPSWEMIKALKAAVFGDIDAMMVLPRQVDYVNVHEHAFHLWQMPEKWGIS